MRYVLGFVATGGDPAAISKLTTSLKMKMRMKMERSERGITDWINKSRLEEVNKREKGKVVEKARPKN